MTQAEYEQLDISILIGSHNRSALLHKTLQTLQSQEELSNIKWEVIVVNNASTDETSTILDNMKCHLPLISLYLPQAGKCRAINHAVGTARGNLLVFTDDDVEPSPHWLKNLYDASLRWPDYSIFGGPIIPNYPTELPKWLYDSFLEDPVYEQIIFAKYLIHQDEGPTDKLPFGPNFMIRAHEMTNNRFDTQIGPQGDNYPMGGETELLCRLVESGARIIYVPEASVSHTIRHEQFDSQWLFKRFYNFGRGITRLKGMIRVRNSRTSSNLITLMAMSLKCIWAFIVFHVSFYRAKSDQFNSGTAFYFNCGAIYEYFNIMRECKHHPIGSPMPGHCNTDRESSK